MKIRITRRNFLKTAGAVAATASAMGMLTPAAVAAELRRTVMAAAQTVTAETTAKRRTIPLTAMVETVRKKSLRQIGCISPKGMERPRFLGIMERWKQM